jgi:hypothetical protein
MPHTKATSGSSTIARVMSNTFTHTMLLKKLQKGFASAKSHQEKQGFFAIAAMQASFQSIQSKWDL